MPTQQNNRAEQELEDSLRRMVSVTDTKTNGETGRGETGIDGETGKQVQAAQSKAPPPTSSAAIGDQANSITDRLTSHVVEKLRKVSEDVAALEHEVIQSGAVVRSAIAAHVEIADSAAHAAQVLDEQIAYFRAQVARSVAK